MNLAELPDLHAPLLDKGVCIYYPYSGGTRHFLMPDDLVVAKRGDGSPDFLLEFVKVQAGSTSDAYGLLEFTVQAHFPMADGLSVLREKHPRGTLAPVPFAGGFLRLFPAGPVATFPDELRERVPLAWNSLGSAPYAKRVRPETAEMLKAALEAQDVLVHAYADIEVLGVSPRLAVKIEFRASDLLDSLAALAGAERRITRDALRHYFLEALKAPGRSPLTISGVVGDALGQQAFADTMADRVRESFATFVPAPDIGTDSYLQLAPPAQFGNARYTWDLAQPLAVHRPFSLYLNPLLTARALVQEKGLEAIYREVVPPRLRSGAMVVAVSANLPEQRPQVWELGAELYAPPSEHRPGALCESVELKPPADRGTAVLRFSPKEPQCYQAQAYLVTAADKLYGPAIPSKEKEPWCKPWVQLTPADFPGRFILTYAGRELLGLATVHGVCTWAEGGAQKSQEFDLQAGRPDVAVWLPDGAENAALALEARALDGTRSLRLDVRPAASTSLDVYSFPQYGRQTLDIECAFAAGARLLEIDLLPEEDRADTAENVVYQFFTPEEQRKQWSWMPRSLFRAGYRYRTHLDGGPSPWSDVRFATEPLRLQARAQARERR